MAGTFKQSSSALCSFVTRNKDLILSALLAIAFLLLGYTTLHLLHTFAEKAANEWTKYLKYSDLNNENISIKNLNEANFQKYIDTLPNTTKEEQWKLKQQLKDIENRAKTHLGVVKAFYVYNYQSIAIATFSSVIVAISLFFISKKGWDNNSNNNKPLFTLFFLSLITAILTGVSPSIFRHESNINDNRRAYLAYIALDDRLRSYIATKQFAIINSATLNGDSSKTQTSKITKITNIKDVIHHVDGELASLNNIYIGFDEKKIPNYTQVLKKIPQSQ
ncbi:hypothetical protein [Scytonema sp. PCC 10023]|uniref:hypothetical protein n=1 Tax=Scytonema sp. PCC 10023 TaxID=1680591 RepID=UPI0039C5F881